MHSFGEALEDSVFCIRTFGFVANEKSGFSTGEGRTALAALL